MSDVIAAAVAPDGTVSKVLVDGDPPTWQTPGMPVQLPLPASVISPDPDCEFPA